MLEKYGGETEVSTEMGNIDLLTDDTLFEIKTYDNWVHAIGQLFAYSMEYPDRRKCLYLFDVGDQKTNHITKLCKKHNIKFMIHD